MRRTTCNELELLLDRFPMTHPHVIEVAEHLGQLVAQWQASVARLETRCSSFPWTRPFEWYGACDHMALFSWAVGEADISGITEWKRTFLPQPSPA